MNKIAVILGGDGSYLREFKEEIKNSDFIIACDRGGDYLRKIDILPRTLIGDMDSIEERTIQYFVKNGVKLLRYDPQKDFTDAYLSFRYVSEKYDNYEINVYAFSGGREDHLISVLMDAEKFTGVKRIVKFVGNGCNIYSTASDMVLHGKVGDTVSVFSFAGAHTSYCNGLMYDISDMEFNCGMTKGISNELTESEAYINIKEGKLTIFHYIN